jgi:hypothetical protein
MTGRAIPARGGMGVRVMNLKVVEVTYTLGSAYNDSVTHFFFCISNATVSTFE